MFKLKVDESKHKMITERLNLTETEHYLYVLTTDKDQVEQDKVNIVFNETELSHVSSLLDWIVKGEAIYIVGSNQYGDKRTLARNISYFITEDEDVYAILGTMRMRVNYKLYELEKILQDKDFIRVSKHAIVNIAKIDYIKPALNSKLQLLMVNGDVIEVNRAYLKAFKNALDY
ncbi:MAG: LytTR family DNA-binding domain-containing protein [Candidatus Izemoplasma sp.]|nr:LytTR family DNA-binding domain-containing protein [Candidatus Izemoplasma sp.]